MLQHNGTDSASRSFILALLGTSEQALQEQGVDPDVLADIYNDYVGRQRELSELAGFISGMLSKAENVHSVHYRVKNPLHLLQKIVRKKKEYPKREITHHNYLDLINDLVGVRVLYLYKTSWLEISRYIRQAWALKRAPYAYVRQGTEEAELRHFAKYGVKAMPHPSGYQAMHFVIEASPGRQRYYAEIQLRTLFEEGWSEIDHSIRYPNHVCNTLVRDLLSMLNRLTNNADDMATFIKSFSDKLQEEDATQTPLSWTSEEQQQWQAQVEKLPLTEEEKQRLHAHLRHLLQGGKAAE